MPICAADLDAMLLATGVRVTIGPTTAFAVRAQQGEQVLEGSGAGGVTVAEKRYTCRTGAFAGLKIGASVHAEGKTYIVRDFFPINAALTTICCAESL